jgi:hypothetical protein
MACEVAYCRARRIILDLSSALFRVLFCKRRGYYNLRLVSCLKTELALRTVALGRDSDLLRHFPFDVENDRESDECTRQCSRLKSRA